MATETNPTIEAEAQTETPAPESQTEPQAQAQTQETNAQGKPEAFDPAKVDPKAKEYFEKTYSEKYKDYEDAKKAAQEWNLVRNDPNFQKWVMERNKPAEPKPFDITDEQFTAGLTDKAQFIKLVQDAAKHLVQNEIGPKLQQTDQHFQLEAKRQELAQVQSKYSDFKELDKRGLIEPIVAKYPNISFEHAYKIAKHEDWAADVAKAARGQVQERKGASIEKPNNAPGARRNVVKVADRLEAMERAAEDFRAGREVAEYEYD